MVRIEYIEVVNFNGDCLSTESGECLLIEDVECVLTESDECLLTQSDEHVQPDGSYTRHEYNPIEPEGFYVNWQSVA